VGARHAGDGGGWLASDDSDTSAASAPEPEPGPAASISIGEQAHPLPSVHFTEQSMHELPQAHEPLQTMQQPVEPSLQPPIAMTTVTRSASTAPRRIPLDVRRWRAGIRGIS
jgi:hypothetical protein